jgi:catechol 2,3-dioxygenase-like lactoylglutathione lyase family enzyme
MKLQQLLTLAAFALSLGTTTVHAQLATPNAEGISAGHTHLLVPDVAKHREIWKSFGAVEASSGRLQLLGFPGMYILLREGMPTVGSGQTAANHIGFTIKDYASYKAKLDAVGATYLVDDATNGQILADLPDGVRVEFAVDNTQSLPIMYHHTHLAAIDGPTLRDWYVKVFGADIGERRGMPSAVIPGGRVDFLPVQGDAPTGSQGNAIDHVGFEVVDMAAFKTKMDSLGIAFNRAPERRDDIGLTIAFITDPVGTYIEITQGLAAAK